MTFNTALKQTCLLASCNTILSACSRGIAVAEGVTAGITDMTELVRGYSVDERGSDDEVPTVEDGVNDGVEVGTETLEDEKLD